MINPLLTTQRSFSLLKNEVDRIAYSLASENTPQLTQSNQTGGAASREDIYLNQQKINKNSGLASQLNKQKNQLEGTIRDIDNLISQLISQKIDLQMQSLNYSREKASTATKANLGSKLDVNA